MTKIKNRHVLIVDDDTSILEVLEARLSTAGFVVHKAENGFLALNLLKKHTVDVLVSDMKMPEMSGMELFKQTSSKYPHLPVIFLTAYGTIPDAVDAVKAGAVDYITKPFDGKDLVKKIEDILTITTTGPAVPIKTQPTLLWGKSKAMCDLKELVTRVAETNVNALILGESGVGKECIAKALHTSGPRRDKPYIIVDCGSTPPGILESELFGHVKGSFTHAIHDKKGLIEAANGGTLFLDEIGNISSEMQSRLLRFLEERKIRQVGAITEKKIDCRVIAATNSDLKKEVQDGNFRRDLYYRLKVVTLLVPPLRARREDIPDLARYFIEKYIKENNLPATDIPEATLQWLQDFPWPGNVRELKNSLESGIVLCRNNRILPKDLQLDTTEPAYFEKNDTAGFSIEQSEKEAIIRALKKTKGVKKEAAELLGISRRAIQYKSKKYNLDSAMFRD